MLAARRHPLPATPRADVRPRRGVALVFVLIFVTVMAALAMTSIFMAGNSNLFAKSYDRERDLRFAAEAALAIGKSRVNADPSILVMPPDSLDKSILLGQSLSGADGKEVPGIKVNVSSHFFDFASPNDPRPWIAPDIAVELSSADYFAGIDTVLQAAIDD